MVEENEKNTSKTLSGSFSNLVLPKQKPNKHKQKRFQDTIMSIYNVKIPLPQMNKAVKKKKTLSCINRGINE